MNKQYIGITGFMSRNEVDAVLASLPSEFGMVNGERVRQLMIGMLVSGKTVKGISNKWPKRYPTPEIIPSVFTDDPRVLNLVHYNTKETDPGRIVEELCEIEEMSGPNFHGFQLNMVWPGPSIFMNWVNSKPGRNPVIVLQCGGNAFAAVNNVPQRLLTEQIKRYEVAVDHVLLDPSGGLGIPFNSDYLSRCLDVLYAANIPDMRFGVAGGLSHETLPGLLEPILKHFPEVSIDAEGRLRDKEDNLDIVTANKYLSAAENLFQKYHAGVSV